MKNKHTPEARAQAKQWHWFSKWDSRDHILKGNVECPEELRHFSEASVSSFVPWDRDTCLSRLI